MDSATRNAGEMINKLTIFYNRSRQAYITLAKVDESKDPKKEAFQPEKGKNAIGAATPMLTPIIPASTPRR